MSERKTRASATTNGLPVLVFPEASADLDTLNQGRDDFGGSAEVVSYV